MSVNLCYIILFIHFTAMANLCNCLDEPPQWYLPQHFGQRRMQLRWVWEATVVHDSLEVHIVGR